MNNKLKTFIVVLLILPLVVLTSSQACTTFCLRKTGGIYFGRNFDFPTGEGHILINKRNVQKTSMIQPPERPVKWISKYGSITFNQAGKEFPYGGINEAGLVIEQMWLDETKYPANDNRYGLTELQWIQYHLDNCATVNEVIASDTIIRVSFTSMATIHFLIADKNGNIATMEYINGKLVCHKGDSLPVTALANDSYDKCMTYLNQFNGFGGNKEMIHTPSSFDRFANTAEMIKKTGAQDPVDYSFSILDYVSQGEYTQWSIVYDIQHAEIYYKTADNAIVRKFSLSDADFSCTAQDVYIDIAAPSKNGKPEYRLYTYSSNRELIDAVFNKVGFLRGVPEQIRETIARYPESTQCL